MSAPDFRGLAEDLVAAVNSGGGTYRSLLADRFEVHVILRGRE